MKRKRTSVDLPAPSSSKHFKRDTALQPIQLNSESRFDFSCDAGSYDEMTEQFVPSNANKNIDWAYKNFQTWIIDHNQLNPDCPCPRDLLEPPWDPSRCHTSLPDSRAKPAMPVVGRTQRPQFILFSLSYCGEHVRSFLAVQSSLTLKILSSEKYTTLSTTTFVSFLQMEWGPELSTQAIVRSRHCVCTNVHYNSSTCGTIYSLLTFSWPWFESGSLRNGGMLILRIYVLHS